MPRKPTFDRDDLIRRARDIFWARGWAGTSLKDLENTLNLRPGSFYAAFGSKDALYQLALERYAEDGSEALQALAQEIGPFKALQTHPLRVLENSESAAKACMLAKTYLELSAHSHPLADRANALLSNMENVFQSLFAQAQSDGHIGAHHDPHKLARRYQSDLLGMRVTAERSFEDAQAIASEIAEGLEKL